MKTTVVYHRTAIVYESQQIDTLENCLDQMQTRTIPTRTVTWVFANKEDAMKTLEDEIELIRITKVTTTTEVVG